MIQSILFFALGFLCAGFLAALMAPAVWRRAVILTRRRIEASVPLTANEIQAEKDRMRADFAMSTRRLEMSIKGLKEKSAGHLAEIGRSRAELKQLVDERTGLQEEQARLEAGMAELRAELAKRQEKIESLADELAGTQASLEQQVLELERLGRAYDDAMYTASTRQIELASRDAEIDKLSADIAHLRNQRREAERKTREVAAEARALRDDLKHERRKAAELETKVERLMATISDREETLERREKELERLRQQLADSLSNETELSAAAVAAEQAKARLEADVKNLKARIGGVPELAPDGADAVVEKLTAERDRLEVRLAELGRENKRLNERLARVGPLEEDHRADSAREDAVLREQIKTLAAEVVSLTAALDGADSPIQKALDMPARTELPPAAGVTSLAERVRALQKAASGARGN